LKSYENNAVWIQFAKIQRTLIFILCIATTIIVGLACFLRYIFHMDLLAYTEYLLIVAFWLYMIGGTQGSYEKSHINADILSVYMKDGLAKDIINLLKLAASLILSAVFLSWALEFAIWSIQLGAKTPVLQIPRVMGECSIAVGYICITFYNFVYFIDGAVDFYKRYVRNKEIKGEIN